MDLIQEVDIIEGEISPAQDQDVPPSQNENKLNLENQHIQIDQEVLSLENSCVQEESQSEIQNEQNLIETQDEQEPKIGVASDLDQPIQLLNQDQTLHTNDSLLNSVISQQPMEEQSIFIVIQKELEPTIEIVNQEQEVLTKQLESNPEVAQYKAQDNEQQIQDPNLGIIQEQEEKITQLKQECQLKQIQINSLQDEIQNIKAQAGQASEGKKMVKISVDELVKWDKRSKDFMSQVKNLQLENQKLKLDLEQQQKLQNRYNIDSFLSKQMKSELSLEGLQERCKALQHIIDSTSNTNAILEKQVTNLKDQNGQIKEDHKMNENEIKQLREISKEKFKLETELTQAQAHIDDLRNKTRDMQHTHIKLNQLEGELIIVQKQAKQSESQKQKFQKLYEEAYLQLSEIQTQRDKLVTDKDSLTSKQREFERMLAQQFKDFAELEATNKEYAQMIEDLKNQIKIMARKNAAEVEELRNEWAKQQDSHKILVEGNKNLQSDLQILRDHTFRRQSVVFDDKKIDKKEKIILESLSSRVNELELENQKLKSTLHWSEQTLEGKKNYILALMVELTKNNPTLLEDLSILDSEDVKVLEKYRKNDPQTLQILLEKLMIENVQLRDQIKILGIELNQMLQKQRK